VSGSGAASGARVAFGAFVVSALCLLALAIAGAIFVIIELNSPFQGLVQVSSFPAHFVWQVLAQ